MSEAIREERMDLEELKQQFRKLHRWLDGLKVERQISEDINSPSTAVRRLNELNDRFSTVCYRLDLLEAALSAMQETPERELMAEWASNTKAVLHGHPMPIEEHVPRERG